MKKLIMLSTWGGLLVASATAAPTIVRATLVGPGGDKLGGTCTFVPSAAFKAADGKMVLPATVEVPFKDGDLRVALQPTEAGTPSVTYRGTCNAPPQSVTGADGKPHKSSGTWGPWTIQVPVSATPVSLDGLVPVPGGGPQVYALAFDANGNLRVPGNVIANGQQLGLPVTPAAIGAEPLDPKIVRKNADGSVTIGSTVLDPANGVTTPALAVAAGTYYVDAVSGAGNDAYLGTIDSPWATLAHAQTLFPATSNPRIKLKYPDGTWRDAPPVWRDGFFYYAAQQGTDATKLYDVFNGKHATLGAGAAAPTWGPVGLTFSGSQYVIASALASTAGNYTFQVVENQAVASEAANYLLDSSGGRLIIANISGGGNTGKVAYYDNIAWRDTSSATTGQQTLTWVLSQADGGKVYRGATMLAGNPAYSSTAINTTTIIGASSGLNGAWFAGTLSSFIAFKRALSAVEVASLSNWQSSIEQPYLHAALTPCTPGVAPCNQPTLALQDGAWCWFNQDRAVRYAGTKDQVYYSYVTMDGDVMIASYNSATGTTSQYALKRFAVDDHNVAGILVKSDGRILVTYSNHATDTMYYRVSANPEDITSWHSERVLLSDATRSFTYPTPMRLAGESNRIYVRFRDGSVSDSRYHSWVTSDDLDSLASDSAATWSPKVQFLDAGAGDTNAAYVLSASNGSDTIYFTHSHHPISGDSHNVVAWYYRAGNFYKPDGALIRSVAAAPLVEADLESGASLAYDWTATGVKGWIWDLVIDGAGKPVIAYATFPTLSDQRYAYARWSGSSWSVHEVARAGGPINEIPLPEGQQYYSGGISIDPAAPETVYYSSSADYYGLHQITKAVTADNGVTWASTPMRTGRKDTRPKVIVNHDSSRVVMWQQGAYPGYKEFATKIMMAF